MGAGTAGNSAAKSHAAAIMVHLAAHGLALQVGIESVLDRVRALPGVTSAAVTATVPMYPAGIDFLSKNNIKPVTVPLFKDIFENIVYRKAKRD